MNRVHARAAPDLQARSVDVLERPAGRLLMTPTPLDVLQSSPSQPLVGIADPSERSPIVWWDERDRIRLSSVFLDRDGVINENRIDHVKTWAEFRFLPGAPQAIARLSQSGLRVFIVSNQAIVNRGIVSASEVDAINDAMVKEIARYGGRIDGIMYCPHRPDEECWCRKPRPGLLFDLADAHAVDLSETLLVGDAASDLEAGRAAGCATLLVLTGRGRDQLKAAFALGPDKLRIASDLPAVADLLLGPDDLA